jgi:hypothetical protein
MTAPGSCVVALGWHRPVSAIWVVCWAQRGRPLACEHSSLGPNISPVLFTRFPFLNMFIHLNISEISLDFQNSKKIVETQKNANLILLESL